MSIKEIRKKSGLTQVQLAKKYRIPLQTIKQWESNPQSTSYRKCPAYVEYMLELLKESGENTT